MNTCLSDEKLELLLHERATWWRRFRWRRHVRRCAVCRLRLEALREDERLLEEVRRAIAAPVPSSILVEGCSRSSTRSVECERG